MKKLSGYLLILVMLIGIVSGTIFASEPTTVQSEATVTLSDTANDGTGTETGNLEPAKVLGHHGGEDHGRHHGHHDGPDVYIGLDAGPESAILLLATLLILVLFL